MFNKRVFITIILSLLLAIGIALITDNKMDDEKYKALFVHKTHSKKKYDVIIAGDSRIYRGISSKIVEDKLNLSAINLGYSSGSHSNLMFEQIDKLINLKSNQKIVILGITPISLTDKASINGHLKRVLNKKKEEILEYRYLFPVKNFFAPSSPYKIKKEFKQNNKSNYHQEFNIDDGWVASWYDKPIPYKALESYKKTFSESKISEDIIKKLYSKIIEWKSKGIKVYGFFIPTSVNMTELEKNVGGFKAQEFLKGFFNAGGLWINIEDSYTSYDGSHLDKESAQRLSNEIAGKILRKDLIDKYQDDLLINDIYQIKDYVFIKEIKFESDSLNTGWFINSKKSEKDSNSMKTVLYQDDLIESKKNSINKIAIELLTYYTDTATEAIFACKINKHKAELNTSYSTMPGKWCKLHLSIEMPDNYKETDSITVYIDNFMNNEIYFNNLKLYYISK